MITKLLIVVMLSLFLFGFASCAMGAGVIYYDQFCGGKVEYANGSKVDMDAGFLGAGASFGKWKVGMEYGKGDFGDSTKDDVSLLSLKAGYRVLDLRATKLDVTVSTLDMDVKDKTELKSNALLGLDFTQFFSTTFFVSATFQYSLNESFTHVTYGEANGGDKHIIVPRIKFSYLVTENVGITAGYSSLNYEIKNAQFNGGIPVNQDTTMGGYTLGMMYKF